MFITFIFKIIFSVLFGFLISTDFYQYIFLSIVILRVYKLIFLKWKVIIVIEWSLDESYSIKLIFYVKNMFISGLTKLR